MKSGSREIQQRMKSQVPRQDELMKVWIGKAAKFYNVSYTQAENFYYRKGYDIPAHMLLELHSLSNSKGFSARTSKRLEENDELLRELKELKLLIRKRDEKFRKALEILAY